MKKIIRDRGSLHNNKRSIHLAVFNVCIPNNRVSKAIKQNPTELKEKKKKLSSFPMDE